MKHITECEKYSKSQGDGFLWWMLLGGVEIFTAKERFRAKARNKFLLEAKPDLVFLKQQHASFMDSAFTLHCIIPTRIGEIPTNIFILSNCKKLELAPYFDLGSENCVRPGIKLWV